LPNISSDDERLRLIERVENLPRLDPNRVTLPACFKDPDISSGVCNPLLPLKPGEPCECSLARSCLVGRLQLDNADLDIDQFRDMPYEAILTMADGVWAAIETQKREESDRQKLRAHVASLRLSPPNNPFRPGSLRHFIVDALSKEWLAIPSLLAKIKVSLPDAKHTDLVLDFVTSVASQEANGYRIVESAGTYRSFAR
jgi:hypothetical protein